VQRKKIINDPVYGFINVSSETVFNVIEHRYFQRLRRIKQLGLTNLVYPGANHTRFHHALGAMHLIGKAMNVLRTKGVDITDEEYEAAELAILMHDIGHGPFSHVLEHSFVHGIAHEKISLAFMRVINDELHGALDMAIDIFTGEYGKQFLHQLVSSQLDVDRLDYLTRDSFYTGVSEGIVGLDRIIEMMNVVNDQLVVDEKGIYSVEKFLVARRLMYWQVYLHKTTIGADSALINVLKRAKDLSQDGKDVFMTPSLSFFSNNHVTGDKIINDTDVLHRFSLLDDVDVVASVKHWCNSDDTVLNHLSNALIQRKLPKVILSDSALHENELKEISQDIQRKFNFSESEASYLVSSGALRNTTYQPSREKIWIRTKNGDLIDLATAASNYNFVGTKALATKYFVCRPK